jgi:hypothetical protein
VTGPAWNGKGTDPWLPERLDARLEVGATERDIRRVVWAELSGWLVETARAVLRGGQRPNVDAVWARVPAWREAVDLIVSGEIRKALGLAFRKVLGAAYPWDQRVRMTAYLGEVRNRLVRVPDEVFDLVAHQVATGVNLGEGIPELRARIDNVLSTTGSERWSNRATVIARTEAIGALNAGRAEAFRAVAEEDPDQPMERIWLCVLPGTPVVANGVQAVARRWYDGEVWELRTASGRRVSLTPQHPVLTARGWVPAQFLQLGDQLLSVQGVDPIGTPGVKGRYALIEECFQAAAETREVRTLTREVPGSVDFNGHPAHEEIDVVAAYGHLSQGVETGLAQDLARLGLELTDKALADLVVQGALPHGVLCDHHARFGDAPGGFKATLTCAVPLDPDDPGGALVAHRDTRDPEDPANRVTAGAKLSAEAVDRTSGLVELDDLIGIEVRTWSGHVYDFTTYCHWFLADGIVVHNSTDDSRTRETHRLADGQRVALGQPFIVGGFELAFPGDPDGPPQEVIQCRCTMLLVEPGETVDMSNRQYRSRR